MKWRHPILLFVGLCGFAWGFIYRPLPLLGENPLLGRRGFALATWLQ